MNFQKITVLIKKPIKAIHANCFHNLGNGLSFIKNLRKTIKIIFNINNRAIQITIKLLVNLFEITSDWYLSEILEIISKLRGIAMAITTASTATISDKNVGLGGLSVLRKK
jgi:uncharacterized protein Yka (UPF0111/DUF47 family)